jgi:tRNA A37 threonylcarbamoyladenosine dehydratase
LPGNKDDIDFSSFDYVIDAVDTLSAKIQIISKCKEMNIPIISSMGTGNKLNPQGFLVADINQTSVCPLARTLRYELKKRNIKGVKVVYSKEEPEELKEIKINEINNKQIPASNSFVPSSCGLLIASEVIKDLLKEN